MRKVTTIVLGAVLVAAVPSPGRAATAGEAGSASTDTEARWSLATEPAQLPSWRFTPTATTNRLVIADVVSRSVIWAVGGGETPGVKDGSVVRSVDGGRSWQDVTPPGGDAEVFRDVEAFDRDHAVVLAIDPPSQIYRTVDGGVTWAVVFEDPSSGAFYDCMAFFDDREGLAMSDPVDGRFRIARTGDGGRTWRVVPNNGMPVALDNEFGLATGTCLQAVGKRDAWFGTATPAGIKNRVFRTRDRGRTWTEAVTPLPGGENFGIRSLSFGDRHHGIAVGGDPPTGTDVGLVAVTSDGGRSWSLAGSLTGWRNGLTWVPGRRHTAVAVGITGSDVSTDGGQTWRRFDGRSLLGVDCLPQVACWAVGAGGLAARLSMAGHQL